MKTAHAKRQDQNLWLALIAASLTLAVTTFMASNRQVSLLEIDIFNLIYQLPGPFTELMYVTTQAGSAGAVLAVVAATFVLKRRRIAALVLANVLIAYLITTFIKEVIARPRPAEILADVLVRLEYASGFGFPSGHTAIATTMALTLMPYTAKKYRWLLWLWIVGVAFSRVYLGVHAPLDIIGGFSIGVMVTCAMRLIMQKMTKKPIEN